MKREHCQINYWISIELVFLVHVLGLNELTGLLLCDWDHQRQWRRSYSVIWRGNSFGFAQWRQICSANCKQFKMMEQKSIFQPYSQQHSPSVPLLNEMSFSISSDYEMGCQLPIYSLWFVTTPIASIHNFSLFPRLGLEIDKTYRHRMRQ